MAEGSRRTWPKACALVHGCRSEEESKTVHALLAEKFSNLIDSGQLYLVREGALLQVATKKISQSTYQAILAEIDGLDCS